MRSLVPCRVSDSNCVHIFVFSFRGQDRGGFYHGGELPCGGRFCRAINASLTIRGRRSHHTHAEINTMRIYGPNGTTVGSPASLDAANEFDRLLAAGGAVDSRGAALGRSAQGRRQYRRAARAAGCRGPDGTPQTFGGAGQGRARRARRTQARPALRQSRRFDRQPSARRRGQLKSSSGDPGLDAVLSEIELRVEVELAKAGQT